MQLLTISLKSFVSNRYRMFLLLALYSLPSNVCLGERAKEEAVTGLPKDLAKILDVIDKSSPQNVLRSLFKVTGEKFTAAFDSDSSQGKKRVLLFGNYGPVIVGVGEGSSIEMAVDTDSKEGIVPYLGKWNVDKNGIGAYQTHARAAACAKCHTSQFVYIWGAYTEQKKEWKGFLGESDDFVDPKSDEWKSLTEHPKFGPLFPDPVKPERNRAGITTQTHRPYWVDTGHRFLYAMPNTQLTLIIGRRAARAAWNRIRARKGRYERYKYSLFHLLACAPNHSGEISTKLDDSFLSEFKEKLPKANEEWEKIGFPMSTARLSMMMLQFLAVSPHQIILRQPWNGTYPLESREAYAEFVQQFTYGTKPKVVDGPLKFTVGDGSTLGNHLAGLVLKDLDVEVPKYLMRTYDIPFNSYADYNRISHAVKPEDEIKPGIGGYGPDTSEDHKKFCSLIAAKAEAALAKPLEPETNEIEDGEPSKSH